MSSVKNTASASILAAQVSSAYRKALAYLARSPLVCILPGDGFSHDVSRDGGGVIYSVRVTTCGECVAHPVGQRAHKPVTVSMVNLFDALHMIRRRLLRGYARPVYGIICTG